MSAGYADEPVMGVCAGTVDAEAHATEPRCGQRLDSVGAVEREAICC